MKTNKEKLDPKVFELAAQLLYSRDSFFDVRASVHGCCHAIEWAMAKTLNMDRFDGYDVETVILDKAKPYYKFLDQYFKPDYEDMDGAYWWKKGVKPPRVIALTICAEILREENAKA